MLILLLERLSAGEEMAKELCVCVRKDQDDSLSDILCINFLRFALLSCSVHYIYIEVCANDNVWTCVSICVF